MRKRLVIKNRRKKKAFFSLSLFLVCLIGIGYAIFETDLFLTGSMNVSSYDLPIIDTYENCLKNTYLSDSYRDKIKTISIETTIDVPNNAIISWDIGVAQNGNVMAYLIPNSTDNTKYDLHIQGERGIFANSDSSQLFHNMPNLEVINGLPLLNTSQVENMDFMFATSKNLTSLDVSNFDTSNVTSMSCMFAGVDTNGVQCKMFLTNIIGLDHFDTSKVTNMSSMFANCFNITTIDLSSFDTHLVTDMLSMFNNVNDYSSQLETILFGPDFDTSLVTNMTLMFADNPKLTNLDVSGFNTSNVISMEQMFINCAGLVTLDLSGWDTHNVTNMSGMFNNMNDNSSLLETITFGPNFTTASVTTMELMFADNPKLNHLNLSSFNTSNVTSMGYMFCRCSGLTDLNISSFDFTSVTDKTSFAYLMPTRADGAIIRVKNATAQSWILNLSTNGDRPSDWNTTNVKYT